MKRTIRDSSITLCLFLTSLTASAQTLKSVRDDQRQVIEKKNQEYFTSIVRNDIHSFASQYADDCWIMVPGLPIHCGPTAPTDYFKAIIQKQNIARGKFITIDLYEISRDMLAEIGFYQFYNTSGVQFDDGKYITLWKNNEGQWKRFRESISSSR